jgi:hypothetical protein
MKRRSNLPISVRLDPETESLVNRLARRTGRTKSQLIREALMAPVRAEIKGRARTRPFKAIAHLIGCARGGPKDLSAWTGDELRKLLQAQVRE